MTKIIFSFDTEDFINPKGVDGILNTAEILEKAGIRGCYNVVAWFAQALVKWGRKDAIEALCRHEIETHSMRHLHHPTICEYTDIDDFDEAMRLFRTEEDNALQIMQDIFGNDSFYAACAPGNSLSYVARYGYADMGIPIYDGDSAVNDIVQNRPVTCSNIDCLVYNYCMDNFPHLDKEDILKRIDEIANYDIFIAYHHPQKSRIDQFCDLLNFVGHNREEWIESNPLPAEATAKFIENFQFFVDTLKKDSRFEFVTYKDIAEIYAPGERIIRQSDIPELKRLLDEDFFPVTLPDSYSISDILLACRDFLLGKEEHKCEKVYGFLNPPFAITQPVKVSAEDMRKSATQIEDGKFLPTEIWVGDKKLGTADWLRAALIILSGKSEAVVSPDKWQIDLSEFPTLRDMELKSFVIYPEEFEDKYISDRCRLQTWTIRLPKGTQRKIFAPGLKETFQSTPR